MLAFVRERWGIISEDIPNTGHIGQQRRACRSHQDINLRVRKILDERLKHRQAHHHIADVLKANPQNAFNVLL
jgi:hypothetical protein